MGWPRQQPTALLPSCRAGRLPASRARGAGCQPGSTERPGAGRAAHNPVTHAIQSRYPMYPTPIHCGCQAPAKMSNTLNRLTCFSGVNTVSLT